jgi:V/A-type H+-transporting ATPase subunit A
MLNSILSVCKRDYHFSDFEEISDYFKNLINLYKQMNYQELESSSFNEYKSKLDSLLITKSSTKTEAA